MATEMIIEDDEIESNIQPSVKPKKLKKMLETSQRVTIIVEDNKQIPPTGLFIGGNGTEYLIKPGVKVDVPPVIISILNDAVESTPIVDGENGQIIGYRDALRYPYRIVG